VGSWETVQLAQPTRGHFDLGTGYHGDVWLDLDTLFLQPALLRQPVRWMAQRLREHVVDAVCGPLEGGAFLAYAVSDLLAAVFLPGYRTPGETAGYHLGPVPGGMDGWRVGIVDDAVNAGTAVIACAQALRGQGAIPVAAASLLALGDASTIIRDQLGVPFYPTATLPSHTWPATECPLCTESIPLTAVPASPAGPT
jgi:orotate phosphoribosyltransferase